MAPRRTDQRLLARPASRTGAGVILALACAALVLGGCGGGSDSSSSTATAAGAEGSSSSGSSPSAEAKSRGSGGKAGANAKGRGGGGDSGNGSSASPGQSGAQGQKHGSKVHIPEGQPEPGITPKQREEATVASMLLESPAATASAAGTPSLPAAYTCDGKGSPPPLHWRGVPQGTQELVLLTMNVQPIEGRLFFDWAVAGLSPDLTEIEAGRLPRGAIVGLNSFGQAGYKVCPATGAETYMFAVYALPTKLSAKPGFDPSSLRKEVLDASGNVGLLALGYSRG